MTVAEIFAAEGEAGFRRRESDAVREAAARRRTVVATGGGAACREENLAAMLAAGRVVALAVSAEEAVRRAGDGSGPPAAGRQGRSGRAPRASCWTARRAFYERAHLRVETDGRTADDGRRRGAARPGAEAQRRSA